MIIKQSTYENSVAKQWAQWALPSLQSPAPQSRHSRRCVSELPGVFKAARAHGVVGQQKIQKKHETTSGPGRFDNQKLILLELLDLATPHCPKASKQSNCTCYHFHTSPPMDSTETWHCKIHCALSFRTNSPARVCIARIGTSADMTTVMTLLL